MFFNRNLSSEENEVQGRGTHLITLKMPQSNLAEQFRTIRTNINFANIDKKVKSILITSSIPKEGKSTLSANLAYVLAQTGKNVLLVDADLRKPTVHRTFNLNNSKGLTTLVIDEEDSLHFNQVVQYSKDLNLYLLPSGPIPPNPSELLGSARMQYLIELFNKHFDFIIYDAPPAGAVSDPQILSTFTDGLVYVVRQGYVSKSKVIDSIKALQSVNSNILGYVLNDIPRNSDAGYYYYQSDLDQN